MMGNDWNVDWGFGEGEVSGWQLYFLDGGM